MIENKDKNIGKPISESSYPSDYTKVGEGDEINKIFISESALSDIKGYLSSDKSNELGGVLLGNVHKDKTGNLFIVIDEIVIARFTEANVVRLTFTHKTWEDINNKVERDFPSKRILGWFHSHPGHTVFLSSYDKFIQENFFDKDFMTAYVYDPVNNTEGFFFWKDKSIEKAKSFYVFSDFQIKSEKMKIMKSNSDNEKKDKDNNSTGKIILIIAIVNLILSVILLLKYFDLSEKYIELNGVNNKLKELKDEDNKINGRIDKLLNSLETAADTSFKKLNNILKYQIKPGDSLRKIAVQYYKDEGKYNLLIRYNNLKDENDVSVGQIIEIPLEN